MPARSPAREGAFTVVVVVLVVLVCFGALIGVFSLYKAWHRAQKRADAHNQVRVTAINIQKADQEAKIVHAQNKRVQALAEQRVIEAEGIRKAQDLISKTLTPLYVSHEAIKAQLEMARSGRNNTSIYIPSGDNGVPLVNDVSKQRRKQTGAPPTRPRRPRA
jgi:hypothetical protein